MGTSPTLCNLFPHIQTKGGYVVKESAQQKELRKRFCRLYLLLGNGEEAAMQAGVPPKEAAAYALMQLHSVPCRRILHRLAGEETLSVRAMVMAGLRRLAFGKANDAVRLVFAEELPPPPLLDQLDLFHVSEIKRDKGGGVEIRLFDRQKAMERLLECANAMDSSAAANALLAAFAAPEEVHDEHTVTGSAEVLPQAEESDPLVAG